MAGWVSLCIYVFGCVCVCDCLKRAMSRVLVLSLNIPSEKMFKVPISEVKILLHLICRFQTLYFITSATCNARIA